MYPSLMLGRGKYVRRLSIMA